MSFTYDSTGPSSTRDWMRLRLGDTVSADPIFTDEELDFFLAEYGDRITATMKASEAAAAQFARSVDGKAGDHSRKNSQLYDHYMKLAKSLKAEMLITAIPVALATSIDSKEDLDQDTDLVAPAFRRGMTDATPNQAPNPGDARDSLRPEFPA